MSAGLVLGSHHETPRGPDDPTATYVPTEPVVSSVRCPPEMHVTARKLGYSATLNQVLKVRAADTGTTVWICSDEGGRLFYQANRGGYEKKWIEGETALFLANVVKDDDGYHATADDGNTFSVNDQRLEIVKNGVRESWKVTPE
ncbi:hypothetical protein [Actinoplanes sp. NPDC049118]|uniref:hypothetical protein n=1 Tax=Actinoplanes sp. NPDC049118 TaxID=3155769 RepID=UPI0033C53432